jgi:hypothetical protein
MPRNYNPEANFLASIGRGLWMLITLPFRGKVQSRKFDRLEVRNRWERIKNLMEHNNPSSSAKAVIEADKLLDNCMKDLGFVGEKMGDRIRSARIKLGSDYSEVWQAHILRNQIVHELDHELFVHDAKRALRGFEKGLKDIGAI